jgi:hypothetical protein
MITVLGVALAAEGQNLHLPSSECLSLSPSAMIRTETCECTRRRFPSTAVRRDKFEIHDLVK